MKKKHEEEHENLERWLVSYADFITLLFAFFTVMYAISQTDKAKYKETMESIQRAFLSAGGLFPQKATPFTPFTKEPDQGAVVPPAPTSSGSLSATNRGAKDAEQLMQKVKGVLDRAYAMGLAKNQVELVVMEGGLRVRLGEYLLFKQGSDKIRRESIPFLYEIGRGLIDLNLPIQVEGHTDNGPGDTMDGNWVHSMNRAYNVVRFLVEGVKFPMQKIMLAAYGDTKPVAGNDTSEGRARNRRVELVIHADIQTWDAFQLMPK